MSKNLKYIRVFLTGGLGNQLFQIAAALSLSGEWPIYYESKVGKPRTNKNGEVQIECFDLGTHIRSKDINKVPFLVTKVFGYTLRSGFNPSRIEKSLPFRFISRLIATGIFSIIFQSWSKLQVGDNIGFTKLNNRVRKSTLIGYFQSYKWLEFSNVLETMSNLRAKNFEERERYLKLASEQLPVMVHLRLTDYLNEQNFGLLSKDYYKSALNYLRSQNLQEKTPNVWVFSDDIETAKQYLDFLNLESTSWFEEIENCPVKTLEVMRMCSSFIMCNSTFSWWAAALRFNKGALVIYPDPWFKSAPTPTELTPQYWSAIRAEWR